MTVRTQDALAAACVAVVLIVLAAAGLGLAQAPAPDVSVRLFQFRPGDLQVKRGARVTWSNQDDIVHTVTSGTPERRDGRFDHRLAGRDATATVEFTDPGVYPYHCTRHPSMRGEIRVN